MQKRLKDIQDNLMPTNKAKLSEVQKIVSSLEKEKCAIIEKLAPKKDSSPKVSDHALVRYLERHHGIKFKVIDKTITTVI